MPASSNESRLPIADLYSKTIIKHCQNPRNSSPIQDPDVEAHGVNPFCGDEVRIQLKLDVQGRVVRSSFLAQGCSIIQASASMLTEATESKSLNQIEDLNRLFRNMMRMDSPSVTHVGDIAALQKIRQFPIRIKCVLLPWTALVEGITEFRARRIAGSD